MNIGEWVIRERYGVGHLVESVVADDAITKCGRRMQPTTSGGALLVADFGTPKCRSCTATSERPQEEERYAS